MEEARAADCNGARSRQPLGLDRPRAVHHEPCPGSAPRPASPRRRATCCRRRSPAGRGPAAPRGTVRKPAQSRPRSSASTPPGRRRSGPRRRSARRRWLRCSTWGRAGSRRQPRSARTAPITCVAARRGRSPSGPSTEWRRSRAGQCRSGRSRRPRQRRLAVRQRTAQHGRGGRIVRGGEQVFADLGRVPAPTRLSCSRRRAGLPSPGGASTSTPNTTVLSAFGVIVSRTRLAPFFASQRVLSSGIVARHPLQRTVRAQRCDGRRRHPARIPRVLQVDRVELRSAARRPCCLPRPGPAAPAAAPRTVGLPASTPETRRRSDSGGRAAGVQPPAPAVPPPVPARRNPPPARVWHRAASVPWFPRRRRGRARRARVSAPGPSPPSPSGMRP